MQNLSDSLSQSDKYPFKTRREEALEWFAAPEGEGSDFAMVCSLAGVDFDATKKRIVAFLSGKLTSIDFRCLRRTEKGSPPTQSKAEYLSRIMRQQDQRKKPQPLMITPEFFKKPPTRQTRKLSWEEVISNQSA